MLASMAKLKAGRLRREVSDACLQYWGGMGYHVGERRSRAPTATARLGLDRRRRRRGHAADHLPSSWARSPRLENALEQETVNG